MLYLEDEYEISTGNRHNDAIRACFLLINSVSTSRQFSGLRLQRDDVLIATYQHIHDLQSAIQLLLKKKFSAVESTCAHLTLSHYDQLFLQLYPLSAKRCAHSSQVESARHTIPTATHHHQPFDTCPLPPLADITNVESGVWSDHEMALMSHTLFGTSGACGGGLIDCVDTSCTRAHDDQLLTGSVDDLFLSTDSTRDCDSNQAGLAQFFSAQLGETCDIVPHAGTRDCVTTEVTGTAAAAGGGGAGDAVTHWARARDNRESCSLTGACMLQAAPLLDTCSYFSDVENLFECDSNSRLPSSHYSPLSPSQTHPLTLMCVTPDQCRDRVTPVKSGAATAAAVAAGEPCSAGAAPPVRVKPAYSLLTESQRSLLKCRRALNLCC